MQASGSERGYLREHFRLFHTIEQNELRVDWHFHTFDKLVFFRSGHVEYTVESENAHLQSGDLMVIAHGQLHKMHALSDIPYERYILYLDSAFLKTLDESEGRLSSCFMQARKSGHSLLRLSEADRAFLYSLFTRLEKEQKSGDDYALVLSHALLIELLVYLCRLNFSALPAAQGEDKISQALTYIQEHLGEDLSCETLSSRLYMSRSSFQHRFKIATGYSPHAYIRLKRLLYASELLSGGMGALQAGKKCGYTDHSAFCHAFTAQFGVSPSAFHQSTVLASAKEE